MRHLDMTDHSWTELVTDCCWYVAEATDAPQAGELVACTSPRGEQTDAVVTASRPLAPDVVAVLLVPVALA